MFYRFTKNVNLRYFTHMTMKELQRIWRHDVFNSKYILIGKTTE